MKKIQTSYRDHLLLHTGNSVSEDTISRFFSYGLPYKGSLVKTSLVPVDKFKPENEVRAHRYLNFLHPLNPHNIIFMDEKSLRSEEMFNRKVRRNPLNGLIPLITTNSNFRFAFSITGFCTINKSRPNALWYRIHNRTNDAPTFRETCVMAYNDGILRSYDTLVIDNATIHNDIEDLLWQNFRVHCLRLPTRTPEWNPMEPIWQTGMVRLKNIPLITIREKYGYGPNLAADAFAGVLDEITFDEVCKYYSHCYDFFPHWKALGNR